MSDEQGQTRDQKPVGTPVDPMPTLTARILRILPRVFLLLVLVTIVAIFRVVLLPFALAVFLAYLLFPVISLIEKGGAEKPRWKLPRWAAVIITYALLFTLGYYTVPPVIVSLSAELQALADQVPQMAQRFETWRKDEFEKWVAEKVEVTELDSGTEARIREDLERLQKHRLLEQSPFPRPLPPEDNGDEAGTGPAPAPGGPPSYSLIHIDVHFPDGTLKVTPPAGEGGAAPPPGTAPPTVPAEGQEPEAEPDPGPAGDEAAAPQDPRSTKRFPDEARDEAYGRILEFVNGQLDESGPASLELPEYTSDLVRVLNDELLGMDPADKSLERFQQLMAEHVSAAIRPERLVQEIRSGIQNSLDSARSWATGQLKKSTLVVASLLEGIFDFFLILMLTAFFLVFFHRVRDYLRDLVPPSYRDDYAAVLKRIDTRLSGAIRGQVVICIVNGFLTYPGLLAIGYLFEASSLMQFALLLSVIASIFSLIPIFGVIISTVPMVIVALSTGSLGAALAVIGWISIIHAIEAYILNPNILGHSAQMNPIIVVFALLAGKQTYGLVGALLAVPIASVVVAMFGYYRRRMARIYAAESGQDAPEDTWGD